MITLGTLIHDIDSLAKKASLAKGCCREILLDGLRIPCHEEALQTVPFFRGCLSFNQGASKIDLEGSGITFKGLAYNLRFVYVHEYLSPSYAIRLLSEALDHGNVQEVLQAADYLQIRRSTHLAVSFMRKHLDSSNVFSVLRLARDLHLCGLKDSCLAFVGYHLNHLSQEDLSEADQESIEEVLQSSQMRVLGENEVHAFILRLPPSLRLFRHLRLQYCSESIRDTYKDHIQLDNNNKLPPRGWPSLLVSSFSDCPEARYLQKFPQGQVASYWSSSENDEDESYLEYLSQSRKRLKVMDEYHGSRDQSKEEDLIQAYDPQRNTWSNGGLRLFKGGSKHGFMLLGEGSTLVGFRRSDQCEDCSMPTPNKSSLQAIWTLDLEENEWREVCPFREELIGPMKAVLLKGVLYIIGLNMDLDIVRRKYDLRRASSKDAFGSDFGDDKISPELFYNSIFTSDHIDMLYLIECSSQNRRNIGNANNLTLSLNINADSWSVSENGSRIYPDSSICFAPHGAFVSGGRSPSASKSLFSWNPGDGAMSELSPMNCVRFAHGSCALGDGRIAVLGGRGFLERDIVSSYEIYDPDRDAWTFGSKEVGSKSKCYPNNVFRVHKPLRIMFRESDEDEGKDIG